MATAALKRQSKLNTEMEGLPFSHLLIVALVAIMIFAPSQLPKLLHTFRNTTEQAKEMRTVVEGQIQDIKELKSSVESEVHSVLKTSGALMNPDEDDLQG